MLVCRGKESATTAALDVALKSFDGRWAVLKLTGRLGDGDNVILLGQLEENDMRGTFVSGRSKEEAADDARTGDVRCEPDPPLPPREWQPEDHVSKDEVSAYSGSSASLVSNDIVPSTTRIGGVECQAADEEWEGDVATFYEGVATVLVRAKEDGNSGAGGQVRLGRIDHVGYGAGSRCKCSASFLHEGLTRTGWSISRNRLIVSGDASEASFERTERRIQACSIEWMGPSMTHCDCP